MLTKRKQVVLKALRAKRRNQRWLAKQLNAPEPYLTNFLNGRGASSESHRERAIQFLFDMSSILNVPAEQLADLSRVHGEVR